MMSFGMDQQYQCFPHHGLSYPSGSGNMNYVSTYNIHANLSQDPYDNTMFYGGAMPYNCLPQGPLHLHRPTNMDIGVPIPPNFYNPYIDPSSSSTMVRGPLNPGCSVQVPSSSGGRTPGASIDEYGSNNVFMAGTRGLNSQSLQPVGGPQLDQLSSTIGNLGTSYNGAPVSSYLHARTENGGSLEGRNHHMRGYNERTSRRSSRFSSQSAQIRPHYQNFHQPVSSQLVRSINICLRPENLIATNNSSPVDGIPFPDGEGVGLRYTGPIPQSGFRMYQSPQTEGVAPEATLRSYVSNHMRYLPEDEVVILSAPGFPEVGQAPGFPEVGHVTDHHQDMRMYIDDMSYEELLALGEQLGNVRTGLSENEILRHLKIKKTFASITSINPAVAEHEDRKKELCVICQGDYQNGEEIGSLDCGHEYHVSCITKWLQLKNVCPICKSQAIKP